MMPRLKELQNYSPIEEKRKQRDRMIALKKRLSKRIRCLNYQVAVDIERKQSKKSKAQAMGSFSALSDNGGL